MEMILGMLFSPDYTLRDFIAIMNNEANKNQNLWTELLQIDLSNTLHRIQIPYYILQGRTDIVASTQKICDFVQSNRN